MSKKNALKVENLTKIYSKNSSKEIKALNNLNLEVKEVKFLDCWVLMELERLLF